MTAFVSSPLARVAVAVAGLAFLILDLWTWRWLLRRLRPGDNLIRAVRAINQAEPARIVRNGEDVSITGWRALRLGTRTVVDVEDVLTLIEVCEEVDAPMEDLRRALRRQYGVMLAPGAYSPEKGWRQEDPDG